MLSDGRIKRVGWARTLWVIVDLMSKIFARNGETKGAIK